MSEHPAGYWSKKETTSTVTVPLVLRVIFASISLESATSLAYFRSQMMFGLSHSDKRGSQADHDWTSLDNV